MNKKKKHFVNLMSWMLIIPLMILSVHSLAQVDNDADGQVEFESKIIRKESNPQTSLLQQSASYFMDEVIAFYRFSMARILSYWIMDTDSVSREENDSIGKGRLREDHYSQLEREKIIVRHHNRKYINSLAFSYKE